ncbi:MAG: hypothetical protein K2H87_04995 [Duncaniella sp.]|nr:hypothetical protein [Duncaniella sp.]
MRTIKFRGRDVAIPSDIEDLTPEQWAYHAILAASVAAGDMTMEYWRVRWFSYLAGLGSVDFTALVPRLRAEAEALVGSVTDPFVASSGELDFYTCRNLLSGYRGIDRPADWLADASYGSVMRCLDIIGQAPAQGKDDLRHEAIARELCSIPEGEPVPTLVAWNASLMLTNVWKAVTSGPVTINGRKLDLSIIFRQVGDKRPDDNTGWHGIALEVATSGVFGRMSDVEAAPFWDVMLYLYKCKFEYINDIQNKQK